MKTHYLDIDSDDHFEFDVFSINCTESMYRVVNAINEQLNIDLQLTELLDFTHETGEEFYFPIYHFKHQELNIEFNLLANETFLQPKQSPAESKSFDLFDGEIQQHTKLLPELDKTDYLLLVKGDNRYLYNHTILVAIQSISLFITVNEVFMNDLKDKKSRSNLLF